MNQMVWLLVAVTCDLCIMFLLSQAYPWTLITKQWSKKNQGFCTDFIRCMKVTPAWENGITSEIPTSMFRLQIITLLIVATYVEFLITNFFSSVACGFWGSNRMRCCAVTSVTSPHSCLLSPPVTNKSSRAISCPTPWRNKRYYCLPSGC